MNRQLTYSQSLSAALKELLSGNDKVLLVGEDLRDPYGGAFKVTKGLSTEFPDRVLNTPISEAAITGLATGMALRGFKPILEIMFGDFIALCADQIINHASKFGRMYNNKVRVPLVIRIPMGGRRGYGPTHSQSLEKIFLGIPGIKIVAPSRYHNAGELLKKSVGEEDVVLFIENKASYPRNLMLHPEDYNRRLTIKRGRQKFETVFVSNCGFEKPDVAIMTYGGMAEIAQEAMLEMADYGVGIDMILPSLIKPLYTDEIFDLIKNCGRVVIAEEGTLCNGWGAEVASLIAEKAFEHIKSPIKRVAALDLPIANAKSLEEQILPGKEDIKKALLEVIE